MVTGSIHASHCVTQPIDPMTLLLKIASNVQKFPEYLSISLSFPELTNSLSFPGFPEL